MSSKELRREPKRCRNADPIRHQNVGGVPGERWVDPWELSTRPDEGECYKYSENMWCAFSHHPGCQIAHDPSHADRAILSVVKLFCRNSAKVLDRTTTRHQRGSVTPTEVLLSLRYSFPSAVFRRRCRCEKYRRIPLFNYAMRVAA